MTHPERRRNAGHREIGRGQRISVNDAWTQQCLETFRSALIRRGADPDDRERLAEQLRERYSTPWRQS